MKRRQMILRTGLAAFGLSLFGTSPLHAANAGQKIKKVLFFSKSSGFEHSAIKRKGDELSFAEKHLQELGPKENIEFVFSKDGSLFSSEYLRQFDGIFFYTTGDLTQSGTDKQPPMSAEGKAALLDAIKNGKGFIGTHSASDTFHSLGDRYQNNQDDVDPYIAMLGGEFIIHGAQQPSRMKKTDSHFPGIKQVPSDFGPNEEWYSLKNFAPDLHVLLVQETEGMKGPMYQRPPYPATWARKHGGGRVFYTNMGHREDVWTNPVFQSVLFGGIHWAIGDLDADVTPNIAKVAPHAAEMPPRK